MCRSLWSLRAFKLASVDWLREQGWEGILSHSEPLGSCLFLSLSRRWSECMCLVDIGLSVTCSRSKDKRSSVQQGQSLVEVGWRSLQEIEPEEEAPCRHTLVLNEVVAGSRVPQSRSRTCQSLGSFRNEPAPLPGNPVEKGETHTRYCWMQLLMFSHRRRSAVEWATLRRNTNKIGARSNDLLQFNKKLKQNNFALIFYHLSQIEIQLPTVLGLQDPPSLHCRCTE